MTCCEEISIYDILLVNFTDYHIIGYRKCLMEYCYQKKENVALTP